MTIESEAYRFRAMRHGYNIARAYRGLARPSWAVFFRGDNVGYATSERKARVIARDHWQARQAILGESV